MSTLMAIDRDHGFEERLDRIEAQLAEAGRLPQSEPERLWGAKHAGRPSSFAQAQSSS
jgi:nitric oxide synthase oxygenase domain/subunit